MAEVKYFILSNKLFCINKACNFQVQIASLIYLVTFVFVIQKTSVTKLDVKIY